MGVNNRRIRVKLNQETKLSNPVTDYIRGGTPETWVANSTTFQFAVFEGVDVSSLDDVQSVNVKIRPSQTDDSVALADKTIPSTELNLALTSAEWIDGSGEHGELVFSNSEMNLDISDDACKSFWIVFTAILTGGEEVTLGGGEITFLEDNNVAADPPPENPGTALTLEQGDSRYLQQGEDIEEAPIDGTTYGRKDEAWEGVYSQTEADAAFDPAGSADGVQINLDNHIADSLNPHSVTAAQVGAISESEADLRYLTAADPTFSNLVNLLEMGNSAGFSVMGDSTGNASNEWVGLVTSELVSRYPNHGVFFDVINTGTGEYDRNTIQALPNGEQYWRVPTSSNIFPIQMGRDAIKRTNRDLDVAVELQLDDWGAAFPNGSTADLLTDYVGGGGNRSFRFTLRQDGRLEFQWTPDGVSFPGALSGIAHTFNGNDRGWLRVSLVGDNGAGSYECKFYQSSDGETWAQIGATRTGVSVGGLFEADSKFAIMQASQQLPPSNIYSVRILDEVDGNICNPQAMDAWSNTSTSSDVELIGSPSLVVTNYSFPGYSTEQAVAVDYGAKFNNNMDTNFFVSLSHNDSYAGGYNSWSYWLTAIEQIVDSLQTRLPFAQPTLVSQNPKTDYATSLTSKHHSLRCSSLAGWALQRGYGHIDAHGAFFADPRPLTQLNDDPDITHPSLEGSQLWADVVMRKIDSALPRFF